MNLALMLLFKCTTYIEVVNYKSNWWSQSSAADPTCTQIMVEHACVGEVTRRAHERLSRALTDGIQIMHELIQLKIETKTMQALKHEIKIKEVYIYMSTSR
jgi:hypothetical protein